MIAIDKIENWLFGLSQEYFFLVTLGVIFLARIIIYLLFSWMNDDKKNPANNTTGLPLPDDNPEIYARMTPGVAGNANKFNRIDSSESHSPSLVTDLAMTEGIVAVDDDISNSSFMSDNSFTINPATGLPMINGIGSVDVAGNTYGSDSMSDAGLSSSNSMFDDGISSSNSTFDDDISSSNSTFDDGFSSSDSMFDDNF